MHIVIITVGSRGDLQPYVALGKGLRAAGHSMRVVTHAPFEEFVRGEGLEFAPLGGDPSALVASMTDQVEPSKRRVWLPRRLGAARDSIRAGRGMSKAVLKDIPEMMENSWKASQGADVLVLATFAVFTGIPTARKLGVPAFVAHPFPLAPTVEFSPVAFPPSPPWLAAFRPQYNLLSGRASEWGFWSMYTKASDAGQQMLRLPVLPPRQQIRELGTPVLHAYSPSFLPPPRDWPELNRVTGYWFLDGKEDWNPPEPLLDFLGAGPPPVYIGFGSMIRRDPQELTDIVIGAVERSRQRAVLMTGSALTVGRVTDDIVTIESAPHDWLFPRVAAVVHHGGAGTTSAGLRAGKPTLIVPFTADQPFWGHRVYERGVGPRPIPQQRLSAETLADGIETAVTDSEIRARANELGKKIRAEDGIGAAIEILSQTLTRPRRPGALGRSMGQ